MTSGWLFAGGAALLTLLATGWSHVKNFCQQVLSRVIVQITVSGYAAEAVRLYLKSKFRASRFGPRAYLGWMLYVRPSRRVQLVPMEVSPPAGKMYWRGWRPVWMFKSSEVSDEIESGANAREYNYEGVSLAFLRGMFDTDQLVIEATNWFNEQVVENLEAGGRRHYIRHVHGTAGKTLGRWHGNEHATGPRVSGPSSNTDIRGCMQYRSLMWPFTQLGPELRKPGTSFDHLALAPEVQELVSEARHWKQSEWWYRSRQLSWRRGWLLHGKPGTGKTALARAMSEDLDLPVFVYDLASLYNNELQEEWSKMLAEVPCMALIEDIDAVFDGRQNVSSRDQQHLTFDCVLNCLDGIERCDGLFLIITTNRIEKVDVALGLPQPGIGSSRPGRVDRVVELSSLDDAGRHQLARRILAGWPDTWDALVADGEGDTGAQFQERCARHALMLHYQQQNLDRGPLLTVPQDDPGGFADRLTPTCGA